MFPSISSSMRVPWGRSHVVSRSTSISGSFVSVSTMSSKYCAGLPSVLEVMRAGLPEVSCE